mgnify:CR=1 FL=1
MLNGFFAALRHAGLKVSLHEHLSLLEALTAGHGDCSLDRFYALARSLYVKRESDYDLYDRVFAAHFKGVELNRPLADELLSWLEDVQKRGLRPEDLAGLDPLTLDELLRKFEERLREQKERHDGGSHWIGTGGTSPFGQGGAHPTGIRVGNQGGGRSAMQVALERRFRNLRHDVVLDTRQFAVALRRLRRLADNHGADSLDVDKSIDKSAREGGEIELVFGPERGNRIKLLLLVDVGGSMDPHAQMCEELFSAAHASTHFKAFRMYAFHNCIYERLYTNMATGEGENTEDVLRTLDQDWCVLLVGDAWMHPFELTQVGGAITLSHQNRRSGLEWLQALRARCPRSVWLNPEPPRIWESTSARLVRSVFPMTPLSVDGLERAVDMLRGLRPNRPDVEAVFPAGAART